MKTLVIEWRHLEVAGATCERCGDTGRELALAVQRLRNECGPKGVEIVLRETRLLPGQIAESNAILIDGVPLESLLPGAKAATSCCASCGELTGRPEECRTLVHLGQVYESIPHDMIRRAVCQIGGCC